MSAAGRGPRWLSRCQYGSAPGRTDLIHRARRVAVHSAADHQSGHRVVSWSKGTFRTEKKLHAVVATGHIIDEADEARFSPLTEEHLHCLGRHAFTASSPAEACARYATLPHPANATTTDLTARPPRRHR